MFKNTGKAIMFLAKFFGEFFVTVGFFVWLIRLFIDGIDDPFAWLSLASACLALISFWAMYAFGQLVDDVHAIRTDGITVAEIKNNVTTPSASDPSIIKSTESIRTQSAKNNEWVCASCGSRNSSTSLFCKDCGKYR